MKEMAYQIGIGIREEVLDLEKAGIRIIQIDEAALKEKLPLRRQDWYREYLDWAIPAFRLCHRQIMLTKVSKEKLWVNPDCGLKTRGIPETEAGLKNLVQAAKIVRENV